MTTLDEAVQENRVLREMLWLRHDVEHCAGLYGDDGEMQCAACGIDFKRLPAEDISAIFIKQGYEKLARFTALNDVLSKEKL